MLINAHLKLKVFYYLTYKLFKYGLFVAAFNQFYILLTYVTKVTETERKRS